MDPAADGTVIATIDSPSILGATLTHQPSIISSDGPSIVSASMTYALPATSSSTLLAERVHDHDRRYLTSACQEGRSKIFVLAGNAGTGKSTLLRQICRYWREKSAFKDKKEAWWLDLSQNDHRKVDSLEKLAAVQTSTTQHMLTEAKESQGRNIVLFIDHLVQLRQSDYFLRQLLFKSILKHCAIILALNYSGVETVTSGIVDFELFDMKGFKTEDVHEVMLTLGRELNVKSMDRMIDFIRSDAHLLDMCCVPSIILQVWEAFKKNNCQCPKTTTILVKDVVDIRVAKASGSESLSETEDHFKCICSIAFKTLDQEEFDEQQFSSLCLEERIPGTGPQIGLGLMQFLKYNGKVSCKFIHKTVKKYLAALHLQMQPVFDQAYVTLRDHDENYDLLIIFFCGITQTNSVKTASLNVAKIILYPLLETMADKYSWTEQSQRTNTLIFFLSCLYEAQEPNLIRKFLSRRQHLLTIALNDEMLTESKLQIFSYCFANSGIKQWKIEATSEKMYLAEYLNMLIIDNLSSELKSEFKLKVNVGQLFQVSPENVREIPQTKFKSNIYSRLMRELLHRLLQLHAPIKLKSDGSSSSYISLLACSCLKNELEKNQVLVLEPVMASHWLPVKPKANRSTSSQQDDNLQTRLHMQQKHDCQHIEYVVMMTPFPHRIRFTVPVTKEKITIQLCSYNSPGFLDSGIESHLNLKAMPTSVIYQERHFDEQFQKLILPSMPLPKQTQSNALTVAPFVTEVPRSPTQRHRSSDGLETTGIPIADADHDRLGQNFVGILPEPVAGAHTNGSPFNCTHGSQSTRQSVHHPQVIRQSALNSGAIVHTAISEVFALDQIYPLPDETNLIRKGGNGEIFLGVFGGTELIFKKTSYRSRELTIHSKLRHQNVIPLLCLMMGEKHPSQRRKWMCYHFLPKATGDLARLISDNEENTLKKLKIKHGDNPRRFGLIQGNIKYILSQILRGLAYLHGLKIVHRDVKASNILLTSNCACSSLLSCTCVRKCDVQIADFDSALQLTDDGLLPVTYTSKMEQTRKIFTVASVGTTGYRPPECSQHVVANDSRSISPPLTTKVDIWSFGVLMMRLVNGKYGPSSQRELSTLLLFYHESKWIRTKPDYTRRCAEDDLTKVLKISKEFPRAMDCIQQCLKVDPENRPSPEELLGHPFLY